MPRPDDRSGAGGNRGSTRPPAPDRHEIALKAAIRAARELKSGQGRREQGRYLLEGVRLVEDAFDQGLRPEAVFLTPHLVESTPRGRFLAERLRDGDWPVFEINERLLRLISDTETPPGVIVVATMPTPLSDLPSPWQSGLSAVLLDHVRDPGNVGGILRTAAAAGIELIVSTEGSVDLYAPKVVRAGAGSHLRLELASSRPLEEVLEWLGRWPQVVLADGRAPISLYEVDWRQPSILVVSNEAHGFEAGLRELDILRVAIPMHAETESLNVAAATAIFLYEARRGYLRTRLSPTQPRAHR